MKFVLDVDGVITEAPRLFAVLSRALRASGHEVHIVSDFDEKFRDQRIGELKDYGIEYDAFVITARKADYFIEQEIDFAFDDDAHEYYPGQIAVLLGIVSRHRS